MSTLRAFEEAAAARLSPSLLQNKHFYFRKTNCWQKQVYLEYIKLLMMWCPVVLQNITAL